MGINRIIIIPKAIRHLFEDSDVKVIYIGRGDKDGHNRSVRKKTKEGREERCQRNHTTVGESESRSLSHRHGMRINQTLV